MSADIKSPNLLGTYLKERRSDGRPDLSMVVYNPATQADVEKIESLLRG
jgi:hypothetical protein